MKNYLKKENGAMAVYALTTILVFTLVLGAIYYSAVGVRKRQLQTMPKIKEVYEKYLSNKYDIYEAEVEKRRDKVPPTISISFSAQTAKVGESVTATITINDNRDRLDTSNCSYTCSSSGRCILRSTFARNKYCTNKLYYCWNLHYNCVCIRFR